MAGRKSLPRPTKKKPVKSGAVDGRDESRKKKAILDGVKRSSTSVKATLKELGLHQSTYYRWLKRYKVKGLDGLESGSPVSDELWQRFTDFEKRRGSQVDESKKIRKLLFKSFDGEASKELHKTSTPETERPFLAAEPKMVREPQKPMGMKFKCAIFVLVLVIAVLFWASISNLNKFYFKQNDKMVELWQGRFAPMGERLVASFSDPKILEAVPEQEACTKKQAFSILSDYFIKRSDELLNAGETPDLKTVKSYLTHASNYAQSQSEQQAIKMRLSSIELLVLLSKADLALSKGTLPDFEAARGYLAQAIRVASTDLQKEVLTKRLAAVGYAIASSKIGDGERQLRDLYREALNRHLQKAKEYGPEKSQEVDKFKEWLDEFDKRHVEIAR
jgi:transposase-like protein